MRVLAFPYTAHLQATVPNMDLLRLTPTQLEVDLKLDREQPVYSHRDTVSGEVILQTDSPADVSSISLSLSAVAIARLKDGRRAEVHQVCFHSTWFAHQLVPKQSF
jgi:hypothetical protein